jgi:hypothetical protein
MSGVRELQDLIQFFLRDWDVRLGQKRTCAAQKVMSALPPKADISRVTRMPALPEPD